MDWLVIGLNAVVLFYTWANYQGYAALFKWCEKFEKRVEQCELAVAKLQEVRNTPEKLDGFEKDFKKNWSEFKAWTAEIKSLKESVKKLELKASPSRITIEALQELVED